MLLGMSLCDVEVWAQEIGGGESRWQVTPSVSLYQQYTDNIDLTNENQVGAYITEFSPGILFQLPSARRTLRIDTSLKLDYRNRDDGNVETLYWYDFGTYLGHQYSPRTAYELDIGYDIYYTEVDISAPFVDVFDALTRSDVFYIKPSLRYNITKTTVAKLGFKYGYSTYEDPAAIDGQDMEGALHVTQKLGSRIEIGTGFVHSVIEYENDTGYTEQQIPVDLFLDLTYIQLNLRTAYIKRSYESAAGPGGDPFSDESFFLYGIGFQLGGQLLRLRSTTVELSYDTNFHDDLYGSPYENQEIRLSVYHAFKKFDFYTDLKYGMNEYTQSDDKIKYWGVASGLKWYISNKVYMGFTADYTAYDYDFDEANNYNVSSGSVDYNYSIYDWLFVGMGYGHRQSSSDVDEGNYAENFYSVFAKATW
jgi:hypothetical protein